MKILSVSKISKKFMNKNSLISFLFNKGEINESKTILEDISFDLDKGETLGIIGKNGAGKSTLLKIISGVSAQTSGSCQVKGTLNSILELGAGFDYELDGESNCYNYLSLHGKNNDQIKKVIDEIKEFSELGDYFYQPLRTYSSGMIIRLAFSCTTIFEPEVLILDEAFAVGDQFFQIKSFKKIKDLKKKGTSIIFVSHDKSSIMNLSDRVLYIENGKQIQIGDPEQTYNLYNKNMSEKQTAVKDFIPSRINNYGSGEAKITSFELLDDEDNKITSCYVGQKVKIKTKIIVLKPEINEMIYGLQITDRFGQNIFGVNTWNTENVIKKPKINSEYEFLTHLDLNLGKGTYSISSALTGGKTHLDKNFYWQDNILTFDVYKKNVEETFIGLAYLTHKIEVKELANE